MNISCASCHVELSPVKIGVPVIEYCDQGPYKIWQADLRHCTLCGFQIVAHFSRYCHEHHQPGFKVFLHDAVTNPYHVCIYETQAQREKFEPDDQP